EAGVFLMFAGGALRKVHGEPFRDRWGVRPCLHLKDEREAVPFRQRLVRDKCFALCGEGEADRSAPVAAGGGGVHAVEGGGPEFRSEPGDAQMAVRLDEEFKERLPFFHDTSTIGAGLCRLG